MPDSFQSLLLYCDKICVYEKHLIAGRDIQYQAPDSRSSNDQLIPYYQHVSFLTRIPQYPVDNNYDNIKFFQNRLSSTLFIRLIYPPIFFFFQ